MTAFRVQAKRTTASGPPADLEFGELAYSDADQQFYVGRPAPAAPATFKGDITPVDLAPVNASIAAIETEQGTQNEAIALLNAASDSQADAIGLLATTTSLNVDAIALINTEQDSQDAAIASLVAASSGQADAIDSLAARPLTYGFTYDQQTEPVGLTFDDAGATWRERSAGGLIVGEWEWSGSVWLTVVYFGATIHAPAATYSANTNAITLEALIPYVESILITKVKFSLLMSASPNATDYWTVRMLAMNLTYSTTASGESLATATSEDLKTTNTPVITKSPNVIVNDALRVRMALIKYANAPNITRATMQYSFRGVR